MPAARTFFLTALAALLSLATCGVTATAGKYNPKLDIGDSAPRWEPLPATDGKRYASADVQGKQATVVVFTCNSCPYAQDVESRLVALHEKYADQGVRLVAINVNKIEEDRLPAMRSKPNRRAFASLTCSMKPSRSRGNSERSIPPSSTSWTRIGRSPTWARWMTAPTASR